MLSRTELLIGASNVSKLANSHVAVFGVGGVGGYVAEMLVRAGVGELTIVDFDVVDVSNINRQIIVLHSIKLIKNTPLIIEMNFSITLMIMWWMLLIWLVAKLTL